MPGLHQRFSSQVILVLDRTWSHLGVHSEKGAKFCMRCYLCSHLWSKKRWFSKLYCSNLFATSTCIKYVVSCTFFSNRCVQSFQRSLTIYFWLFNGLITLIHSSTSFLHVWKFKFCKPSVYWPVRSKMVPKYVKDQLKLAHFVFSNPRWSHFNYFNLGNRF